MPTKKNEAAEKANRLYMDALENRKRLEACPRHLFDFPEGESLERLKCLRCEAFESTKQAVAYIKGYTAAGGKASEVVVGRVFVESARTKCPECDAKGRPPFPGAWKGKECPLCGNEGHTKRKKAVEWLIKEGVKK